MLLLSRAALVTELSKDGGPGFSPEDRGFHPQLQRASQERASPPSPHRDRPSIWRVNVAVQQRGKSSFSLFALVMLPKTLRIRDPKLTRRCRL